VREIFWHLERGTGISLSNPTQHSLVRGFLGGVVERRIWGEGSGCNFGEIWCRLGDCVLSSREKSFLDKFFYENLAFISRLINRNLAILGADTAIKSGII